VVWSPGRHLDSQAVRRAPPLYVNNISKCRSILTLCGFLSSGDEAARSVSLPGLGAFAGAAQTPAQQAGVRLAALHRQIFPD
jgi:hypothetical protein